MDPMGARGDPFFSQTSPFLVTTTRPGGFPSRSLFSRAWNNPLKWSYVLLDGGRNPVNSPVRRLVGNFLNTSKVGFQLPNNLNWWVDPGVLVAIKQYFTLLITGFFGVPPCKTFRVFVLTVFFQKHGRSLQKQSSSGWLWHSKLDFEHICSYRFNDLPVPFIYLETNLAVCQYIR